MSLESIKFKLEERFAAPLPDFYQRRIIFWHDAEREFETMLDEISIPDVTVIKLTGTNNFAVKKLLLHDDLTGNYLIYNPFVYSRPQDNWLLDIVRFSEEFRSDYYSMLMEELNIEPSPHMQKTVKLYSKFLKSKERRDKIRRIGHQYQKPLLFHIDIMAVLAGVPGGTMQDIFIAVLSDDLDEEKNGILQHIKGLGNIEAFWELARKYTGYIHEEGDSLGLFAAHVLLTALAQTMNANVLSGLERFLSESSQAYCYSIIHEWRSHDDNAALWELCRYIEQELQLPSRFEQQDIGILLAGDIFPSIHEAILKHFLSVVSERMIKADFVLKTVEKQRTSGWYEQFADYYTCLYYIAKMQLFYQDNAEGFHFTAPDKVWQFYTEKGYQMDSFYRHFHFAFGSSRRDSNPYLDDKLKGAADYAEALYQNWYLKELTECWKTAASEELAALGYCSEIKKQSSFYTHYVMPLTKKKSRVFVIISDALRYEVAAELCGSILGTTKGTAALESIQAVFPSITKFGMAALLPGSKRTVNEKMDVFVDDMPSKSTAQREKILCAANPNSIAVQYTDMLKMTSSERKAFFTGKEVVYIYHNTIDAAGDKAATEGKVFEACKEAIGEISDMLNMIIKTGQGTNIFITADHGFLYTYSPLKEGEKLDRSAFSEAPYEMGRRYALTSLSAAADFLMPVQFGREIGGAAAKGYTPQDLTRIKTAGGGENYVHGGISLQEMAVPVIIFKNLRSTSKDYVEISRPALTLLSDSTKISNLVFPLNFFQHQPVGGKVQPCTYTLYMADANDRIISDRQSVIADRTDINDAERVFRVRFNLKAGSYDRYAPYYLHITNGVDMPQKIEFHIDIAFSDDFGFDL